MSRVPNEVLNSVVITQRGIMVNGDEMRIGITRIVANDVKVHIFDRKSAIEPAMVRELKIQVPEREEDGIEEFPFTNWELLDYVFTYLSVLLKGNSGEDVIVHHVTGDTLSIAEKIIINNALIDIGGPMFGELIEETGIEIR